MPRFSGNLDLRAAVTRSIAFQGFYRPRCFRKLGVGLSTSKKLLDTRKPDVRISLLHAHQDPEHFGVPAYWCTPLVPLRRINTARRRIAAPKESVERQGAWVMHTFTSMDSLCECITVRLGYHVSTLVKCFPRLQHTQDFRSASEFTRLPRASSIAHRCRPPGGRQSRAAATQPNRRYG